MVCVCVRAPYVYLIYHEPKEKLALLNTPTHFLIFVWQVCERSLTRVLLRGEQILSWKYNIGQANEKIMQVSYSVQKTYNFIVFTNRRYLYNITTFI